MLIKQIRTFICMESEKRRAIKPNSSDKLLGLLINLVIGKIEFSFRYPSFD